ncbi:uncharacterized protein LOC143836696 [Paroedura picta]|uniref:uncharacterized protein LOC143836696 n=1 Tax=Paroedura picta TaxID=143630 RepID=UPI0040575D94
MASGPPWGLPAGPGDLEDIWRALGTHLPPLPHFPCAYPALPCCGILPTPPLGLFAQPVSAPGEAPGPARYWPAAPPGVVVVEEAWRAKASAAASRESTAALKAWLGRHRRNPYPTKGEKVLLALGSRMSLTQVSTWFANARRRLKKEQRAARSPPPPDGSPEPGPERSPPPPDAGPEPGPPSPPPPDGGPEPGPPSPPPPDGSPEPGSPSLLPPDGGPAPGSPSRPPPDGGPAPAQAQAPQPRPATIWRPAELATRGPAALGRGEDGRPRHRPWLLGQLESCSSGRRGSRTPGGVRRSPSGPAGASERRHPRPLPLHFLSLPLGLQ